jgi:hypothetical protein
MGPYFMLTYYNKSTTTQIRIELLSHWIKMQTLSIETFFGQCIQSCRNPTLKECEDDTHTPEMGTWKSFRTPENSEFDCRGQNILP